MSQLGSKLWSEIFAVLSEIPFFQMNQEHLKSPELTTRHIIENAYIAWRAYLTCPTFTKIWDIIQKFVMKTQSDIDGEKYWGGDTQLVGLLKRRGQLAVPFANPGDFNFMNLYANWEEAQLKESRFGRAVWSALHDAQEERADEELVEDDFQEVANDESSLGITSSTIDLDQMDSSSSNNTTFINNEGQTISGDKDSGCRSQQLCRPTPDREFKLLQIPPARELSRVAKDKVTPKDIVHTTKPFSQMRSTVEGTIEGSQGCECGHSNFALSLRPISTMVLLPK
ncbi:hypothetical protein P171DRAFT_507737 [Karstenula rhodostoma CBS 690.94]|uniref:Uncharacterized protein n=1 Tax=Karstenula rhodostoma CBS 690.94 TaxID=1392251 RepID=A0A9P4PT49_9PLEO|nr:hypothetical protein P171DRAFT_507737 [Karstenula rhodostoma CBS 690.94]